MKFLTWSIVVIFSSIINVRYILFFGLAFNMIDLKVQDNLRVFGCLIQKIPESNFYYYIMNKVFKL